MEERQHAPERERAAFPAPAPEPEAGRGRLTADASTAWDLAVASDAGPDALSPEGALSLQQAAGNEAVGSLFEPQAPNPVAAVVGAPGSPLDAGLRAEMEAQFGADFGSVRVHAGGAAAESASALSAAAYTTGEDIVIGSDVDTASPSGRKTIAHELTHVLQQREGPVAGTDRGDGLSVSDPSDAFEQAASATARQVAAAGPAELA